MPAIDWTVLGIADLIIALAVAGAVSGLLAWRLPMAPLAPAIVAGGTAAGLVLLFGRVYPAIAVLAGSLAAMLAGLAYDRGVLPRWGLAVAEAAIAFVIALLAVPLLRFGAALGLAFPAPVAAALVAGLIVLFSGLLSRTDRLPGTSAAIAAAVASLATFFAVWRGVAETQSIWWLAALGAILVGAAIVSRARATPLAAAGTSYVAHSLGLLIVIVIAFAPPLF